MPGRVCFIVEPRYFLTFAKRFTQLEGTTGYLPDVDKLDLWSERGKRMGLPGHDPGHAPARLRCAVQLLHTDRGADVSDVLSAA